jgi:hypothetical protein
MAVTQIQLDAIDDAIARGVLTVEYDGHRVTYHSLDELLKARRFVAQQLSPVNRQTHARFTRD